MEKEKQYKFTDQQLQAFLKSSFISGILFANKCRRLEKVSEGVDKTFAEMYAHEKSSLLRFFEVEASR